MDSFMKQTLSTLDEAAQDFYPGSSRPIQPRLNPEAQAVSVLDSLKPKVYTVGGKDVAFYTVGQLAAVLDRQAGTVRRWERDGIIPKATFRVPSDDPRGKRRLYTRAQVEGIAKIAAEEGLIPLGYKTDIKSTKFTLRVLDLFRRLGAGQ